MCNITFAAFRGSDIENKAFTCKNEVVVMTGGQSNCHKVRWRHLRGALAACLLAASLLVLGAPLRHEISLSVERRRSFGYGSNVVWGTVRDSVSRSLEGNDDEGDKDLISEHDLFMLVQAALFHISRDPALGKAQATKLPVRYSYLDGYDQDVLCTKLALAEDLPALGVPNLSSEVNPLGFGADAAFANWGVSPVLLGWPASPNLRTLAQQVIADDVLLSVHTAGQVVTPDVHTWDFRYALGCIREDPSTRATEIARVEERVRELSSAVARTAGDDDRAYVRAAFQLIADATSYAQGEGASVHFNDVYGALVEGSSQCYGISGALKLLLDKRGIPNYLCNGTKPSGRHTWNVVWLDGGWYVCDATLVVDAAPDEGERREDAVTYACLTAQRNFYIEHHYVPDDDARLLQLVYEGVVSEIQKR